MNNHAPKHHGEPEPDDDPGHLPVEPDQGPSPASVPPESEPQAPASSSILTVDRLGTKGLGSHQRRRQQGRGSFVGMAQHEQRVTAKRSDER